MSCAITASGNSWAAKHDCNLTNNHGQISKPGGGGGWVLGSIWNWQTLHWAFLAIGLEPNLSVVQRPLCIPRRCKETALVDTILGTRDPFSNTNNSVKLRKKTAAHKVNTPVTCQPQETDGDLLIEGILNAKLYRSIVHSQMVCQGQPDASLPSLPTGDQYSSRTKNEIRPPASCHE